MKKEKIIIILGIFALVILIIMFLANVIKKGEMRRMPVSIDGKTAEGQLLFNGVGVFTEKYTGFMSRADITNRFTSMITEEWPEMCSELKGKDRSKIEEYYKNNQMNIKENYGCKSADEFASMIDILQSKNVDLKKYNKLSISSESFKDESDKNNYAYAECEVSYPGDEYIRFTSHISKKKSIKPYFIIEVEK